MSGDPVVVALDVGGTSMKGAIALPSGEFLATERRPTPREQGPATVVEAVLSFAAALCDRARSLAAPVAAGVAVPGIVDDATGTAVYSTNLGWRNVPFRTLLTDRLALRVAVGHDVRTGGIGEAVLGAGRGASDFLFLPIGTGVSAALMIGGTPYPGSTGSTGEIGHIIVRPGGTPCPCGAQGCLEAYASAAAISRRYTHLTPPAKAPSANPLNASPTGSTPIPPPARRPHAEPTPHPHAGRPVPPEGTTAQTTTEEETLGQRRSVPPEGATARPTNEQAALGPCAGRPVPAEGTAARTVSVAVPDAAGADAGMVPGQGGVVPASEVVARALAGDPVARRVWEEALDALADGLVAATMVADPGLIVVGGGLAQSGVALFEPLAERLAARFTFRAPPRLAPAELGDRAAMHGAAILAWRAVP